MAIPSLGSSTTTSTSLSLSEGSFFSDPTLIFIETLKIICRSLEHPQQASTETTVFLPQDLAEKKTHLKLTERMQGGFKKAPFVNLNEVNTNPIDLRKEPHLKEIKKPPGLYLRRGCVNESCDSYGKYRWIHKGMGTFDMTEIFKRAICSICHQESKIINNCGFYRCVFSILGNYDAGDGEVRRLERSNVEVVDGNIFLSFKDYPEQILHEYYSLQLEVKDNNIRLGTLPNNPLRRGCGGIKSEFDDDDDDEDYEQRSARCGE